ncbi:hypothetical protein BN863_21760 [Formosa agariphila KMM 3901]|uniref:Uncharacterized protein n=1 Tax=Formosa agariphila (strain DSM 15362 / KCTC 12365 / LMG 23005 / KMM 3901 / M-2Alg 35-1) TaxID=1347342 RepID=T2KN53_FORAG|nr:hypothetical protein BN863_21760 [Formosa agariphila KMM 3901]
MVKFFRKLDENKIPYREVIGMFKQLKIKVQIFLFFNPFYKQF